MNDEKTSLGERRACSWADQRWGWVACDAERSTCLTSRKNSPMYFSLARTSSIISCE